MRCSARRSERFLPAAILAITAGAGAGWSQAELWSPRGQPRARWESPRVETGLFRRGARTCLGWRLVLPARAGPWGGPWSRGELVFRRPDGIVLAAAERRIDEFVTLSGSWVLPPNLDPRALRLGWLPWEGSEELLLRPFGADGLALASAPEITPPPLRVAPHPAVVLAGESMDLEIRTAPAAEPERRHVRYRLCRAGLVESAGALLTRAHDGIARLTLHPRGQGAYHLELWSAAPPARLVRSFFVTGDCDRQRLRLIPPLLPWRAGRVHALRLHARAGCAAASLSLCGPGGEIVLRRRLVLARGENRIKLKPAGEWAPAVTGTLATPAGAELRFELAIDNALEVRLVPLGGAAGREVEVEVRTSAGSVARAGLSLRWCDPRGRTRFLQPDLACDAFGRCIASPPVALAPGTYALVCTAFSAGSAWGVARLVLEVAAPTRETGAEVSARPCGRRLLAAGWVDGKSEHLQRVSLAGEDDRAAIVLEVGTSLAAEELDTERASSPGIATRALEEELWRSRRLLLAWRRLREQTLADPARDGFLRALLTRSMMRIAVGWRLGEGIGRCSRTPRDVGEERPHGPTTALAARLAAEIGDLLALPGERLGRELEAALPHGGEPWQEPRSRSLARALQRGVRREEIVPLYRSLRLADTSNWSERARFERLRALLQAEVRADLGPGRGQIQVLVGDRVLTRGLLVPGGGRRLIEIPRLYLCARRAVELRFLAAGVVRYRYAIRERRPGTSSESKR